MRSCPRTPSCSTFLKTEYLPHARDTVGLGGMPGGDAYYRYMIESNTTRPMTAQEVHQLGLDEVARITKEMETIKDQVGFKGDLHAFFQFMTTDPKFAPPSRQWLETRYRELGAKIDKRIPEQFSLVPKTRARDPARASLQGEELGRRRIYAGLGRRFAPGRVLLQRL